MVRIIGGTPPSAAARAARGCRSGGRGCPRRRPAGRMKTASASSAGRVEPGRRGRERLRIAQLGVVDPRARRLRDLASHARRAGARRRARPPRTARLGGVERARRARAPGGAPRRRGGGCGSRARARPARAAVGAPDDLDVEQQVAHQPPDHRELLVVLLAEHRDVRLGGAQQLRHHRRDAAEVARARARRTADARARVTSTKVCAPVGYSSATSGAKTTSTPARSAAARGRSRARAGSAARSRGSSNWVGFTKIDTTTRSARRAPRPPARRGPRAARPSSAPARCAAPPRARRRRASCSSRTAVSMHLHGIA